MKNYTCDSPVFSSSIKVIEVTDLAYAPNVNTATMQLLQNDLVLASVLNADLVEEAFKKIFRYLGDDTDDDAMTEEDVEEAIDTIWDGATSDDPDALSSTEVTQALTSTWNGEASTDPDAMTPEEINDALAAGELLSVS
jgi:hypothetical protein